MVLAQIDPSTSHELTFDLNISGSKDEPSDIRFIIESQIDPATGDSVQDVFSIICRAVRGPDGVKITIPRLLNLFRSGSYKSRLEVVLEGRLFVPLSEELIITEPTKIEVKETKTSIPNVSVSISNIVAEIAKSKDNSSLVNDKEPIAVIETAKVSAKSKPTPFVKKTGSIDKSWRDSGFTGIKNPFKNKELDDEK